MSNKKVFLETNVSSLLPRMTFQESRIHHFLKSEFIFSECQKVFRIGKRRIIVDFFIGGKFILECSSTKMKKFQVPIRLKAIQLEEKCHQLSQVFNYPIWVLFEAPRPISSRFLHTLTGLMPSVDKIFISYQQLTEFLVLREVISHVLPAIDLNSFESRIGEK